MPSPLARFPTTRWTLLQKLRDGTKEDAHAALETLCRDYWAPLYAVGRHDGMGEHDAQDAVQGFFVTLLRRETFSQAEAAQGRLRSLLLKSFKNYCCNEWRKDQRQKRGEGVEHVPLHDVTSAEERLGKDLHGAGLSMEKLYAREWARAVLSRSLANLRQQYLERGQEERFNLLQGPLMEEDDAVSLDQLASSAGMAPGALRVALHRMRGQYRTHVERELACTLDTDDPAEIQHEIKELFQAFE
ncbi:MAG: RNA polymerase sigma factor [Prosthecobacter sp.]